MERPSTAWRTASKTRASWLPWVTIISASGSKKASSRSTCSYVTIDRDARRSRAALIDMKGISGKASVDEVGSALDSAWRTSEGRSPVELLLGGAMLLVLLSCRLGLHERLTQTPESRGTGGLGPRPTFPITILGGVKLHTVNAYPLKQRLHRIVEEVIQIAFDISEHNPCDCEV